MRFPSSILAAVILFAVAASCVAAAADGAAQPSAGTALPAAAEAPGPEPLPEEYSCSFCHGGEGTLSEEDDTKHLIVTAADLAADIHWQKGIRCHDCHGGNANLEDYVDHRKDPSFRTLDSPADIPAFCGHCHSDIDYMRRYDPSPRIDQVSEYWTSGHGRRLKQHKHDSVATCVSCHGHHDTRAVDDLDSRVFPTRVAKTCASCHSDGQLMAGRQYQGRPLGHDQVQRWANSVHAQALMQRNDLSAPTCNDCHGNHGALPPNLDSITNVCGTCHVKVAQLFSDTVMQHRFEQVDLPGCATCHGNHEIHVPTDEMLGMQHGAVCAPCHEEGKYGATLAGADVARAMRAGLVDLRQQITLANAKLDKAERLGMEVQAARFDLRAANDALTNARTLVHSFAVKPMKEALDTGLAVGKQVEQKADQALQEHTNRRIWLAVSMVPILAVVGLLLLYVRTLPPPKVD